MKVHSSPEESRAAFLEQFEEGNKNGYWMGVVWTLERSGAIKVGKTTSDFSKVKYIEALLALKKVLDDEIELELVASIQRPLPLAPHLQVGDIQGQGDTDFVSNEFVPSDRSMFDKDSDIFPSHKSNDDSNNESEEEKKSNEDVV